jgi:hypothetical protein
MKKHFTNFILLIILLAPIISCTSSAKMYYANDIGKTYTGQLDEATFTTVKQFLISATNLKLNDTLIITYDYNHETCWSHLDESDDDYIMGFVIRHKQRFEQISKTRPNVSIFSFREPGNKINKIKKWDETIIIDSTKKLFELLFKERTTCGSSVLILPDKRFIFFRSDAHSDIFDLNQLEMEKLLLKK